MRSAVKLVVLPHLDDIETHVDDVLRTGAVVSGSWIALEGIAKVTAVQVVVAQVVVASPEWRRIRRTSDFQVQVLDYFYNSTCNLLKYIYIRPIHFFMIVIFL